jgi:hypothetical protein
VYIGHLGQSLSRCIDGVMVEARATVQHGICITNICYIRLAVSEVWRFLYCTTRAFSTVEQTIRECFALPLEQCKHGVLKHATAGDDETLKHKEDVTRYHLKSSDTERCCAM